MSIRDSRPPDGTEREKCLLALLQRVWTYPFTTKSDMSRDWADELAEAASRDFVTTSIIPGKPIHGRIWKITVKGLSHLTAFAYLIAEEEVAHYVAEYSTPQDTNQD